MSDQVSCLQCGAVLLAGTGKRVCSQCQRKAQIDEATIDTHSSVAPTSLDEGTAAKPPAPGAERRETVKEQREWRGRFFGDYELLEEIARGGMGVVYKARQISLNRIVALKMILAGQLASDQEVQRFRAEAEAAANLDHPGIVPIYEIGEHDGQHYFSMGFVEGPSLSERLRDGPLATAQAAIILSTVAEAVAYAHERGVIHRDLKPANVLMDPTGQPRITDFGLAKRTEGDSQLTGTGQILGTPSYMPPEQAAGTADVGPSSDIYSLGALLYCLLIARPPFQAANPLDTLRQVLHKEPTPLQQLNAAIPRDLETICLTCLQKEPHRRYPSAIALAEDLRRFLADEPIVARPIGRLERTWRWAKRRPAIAALSLAVALIGTLGVAGITWQWRKAEFQRGEAVSARFLAEQQQRKTLDALDEAETHLYFNRITVAHGRWLANTVLRAEELLDECPSKQRGWEWHYLKQLCHGALMTLQGHDETITCLAYSPDGHWLASASRDGMIRIWETDTGRHVQTLLHRGIYDLTFTPDGNRLVSGAREPGGSIRVWDVVSGKRLQTLAGRGNAIRAVTFHANGRDVITGGLDGAVRVWDLSSGHCRLTMQGHSGGVTDVVGIPETRFVASGSNDGTVRVWDIDSGATILTTPSAPQSPIYAVAVAPGGDFLVFGGSDQKARLWDWAASQQTGVLRGHTRAIYDLDIAPDGRSIVTASYDRSAKVWDAVTRQELFTIRGHYGSFHAAVFSPDGTRIATGSSDRTVKIWAADTPLEYRRLLQHEGPVRSMAWVGGHQSAVSMSTRGNILASHVQTGEPDDILTVGPHRQAAFSPNGERVAVAHSNGSVELWDLNLAEKQIELSGHTGPVEAVAFHPNRDLVASGGEDMKIRLWNVRTGQQSHIFDGHDGSIVQVVFSKDGKRLAASDRNRQLKVWDTATGETVMSLQAQNHNFDCMAFSPDGDCIAVGPGQRVALWQLDPLERKQILSGHASQIRSITFSPDGKRIASSSSNRKIKIWDAASGHEALTLTVPSAVNCLDFSEDGHSLMAGADDGSIFLFDATPVEND